MMRICQRALIAGAAVPIVLIAACSGISVQTAIYQTLDEARLAGAIDQGWVPRGLPASSADLREGHLADGRVWGNVLVRSPRSVAARGARRIGDPHWTRGVRSPRPVGMVAADPALADRSRAREPDRTPALSRSRRQADVRDQLGTGQGVLLALTIGDRSRYIFWNTRT